MARWAKNPKYALGLELTDPGFDYSVLSEFRQRLLSTGAEQQLFEAMLALFQEKGLLKVRESNGPIRRTFWQPSAA